MSTPDENFMARLRETFQMEAREHLHAIASTLLELERLPAGETRPASLETAYRSIHSLKGAARSVGFTQIEAICQAMESVFHDWKTRSAAPANRAFDTLHHALDTLTTLLSEPGSPRVREDVVHRLEGLVSGKSAQAPAPVARYVPLPQPVSPPADQPTFPSAEPLARPEASQTVRISVAKLDARLLQAQGMLASRNSAIQHAQDLQDAAAQMELWHARWLQISDQVRAFQQAAQSSGNPSQIGEFLDWNHDFLRSLHERVRALSESAVREKQQLTRSVDDLLDDSLELLMLPFRSVADLFPKIVRDLCSQQGKQAILHIHGADTPVDKRVLEETKDLFVHILRNCVDHAVETPDARIRAGKPPAASIDIAVTRPSSGSVLISITDDGAGIDAFALKASAVRLGHLSQSQAEALSEQDAFNLMFLSGTTTSPQVTSISGRGLGMAIVHSKILALGGRLDIQSKPGRGTTFEIRLPSTLTTFRGILVKSATTHCLVSINHIQCVTRIHPSDISSVENRPAITLNGKAISLARLDAALGIAPGPAPSPDHPLLPVIVLSAGQQQIAFLVDDILHEEQVLVKSLPKPLLSLRNIAGAALTRAGDIALVLDAPALLSGAHAWAQPVEPLLPAQSQPAPFKRVLVVEDSITSRMLLKSILEGAGYKVRTAVDGIEAFTLLREELFDLVVSDIEMPRLNGLDLTARIRSQPRFQNLPVILVTALESQDQRERGIDAGANAYIVKSSFDQSNLLQVVKRLI